MRHSEMLDCWAALQLCNSSRRDVFQTNLTSMLDLCGKVAASPISPSTFQTRIRKVEPVACLDRHANIVVKNTNSVRETPERAQGLAVTSVKSSFKGARAVKTSATSGNASWVRRRNPEVETPSALRIPPWTGSAFQARLLEKLKQNLAKSVGNPNVPEDETLRWFLRDRNFELQETEAKLKKTIRWRMRIGWGQLTWDDVKAENKLGKCTVHDSPDVVGRPVVILRPVRHRIGSTPLISTQKLCVLTAEAAMQRMDDGCDTALAIFDLRGFGPENADLGLARFLVDLFFIYYPRRLGQVLVVDAPWVFQPVWQVIKPWLGKYSQLVRFVSVDQVKQEYFLPNTVPSDFR